MKLFSSSYVKYSDEELMELIIENDHKAFNEIYSRYKTPIYSYFSRLSNTTVAEELIQDVFLKIIKFKTGFRRESKFKTWLWSIARNTLIDYYRIKKYSFESLDENEDSLHALSDSDLEFDLISRDNHAKILEIILNLEEKEKEILLFLVTSDLTYEEISKITTIKVNTVKTIVSRARKKILDEMKRKGVL